MRLPPRVPLISSLCSTFHGRMGWRADHSFVLPGSMNQFTYFVHVPSLDGHVRPSSERSFSTILPPVSNPPSIRGADYATADISGGCGRWRISRTVHAARKNVSMATCMAMRIRPQWGLALAISKTKAAVSPGVLLADSRPGCVVRSMARSQR